jgi:hypothetical protein
MRLYQLTREGRKVAKLPTHAREPILDFLYENKTATVETLKAVSGLDVHSELRRLRGYVEEVPNAPI